MLDAREHGAIVLTAHEVTGLIREGATVCGVHVRNHLTGETQTLHAPVVVNAAGIWGQRIAEYADLSIRMFPAKGSLLIMDIGSTSMSLTAAGNHRMPTFWYTAIRFH